MKISYPVIGEYPVAINPVGAVQDKLMLVCVLVPDTPVGP